MSFNSNKLYESSSLPFFYFPPSLQSNCRMCSSNKTSIGSEKNRRNEKAIARNPFFFLIVVI